MNARTLSDQRYAETFQTFVSRSNEYPAMLRCLAQVGSTLTENFSCLDVGAGTGSLIRDWKDFSSSMPSSSPSSSPGHYVAIEPNEAFVPMLQKTISDLNISGYIINSKVEDSQYLLQEEKGQQEKFDMILFSHSLYYLSNPCDCVERFIKSCLKPNGLVLIFHIGPYSLYTLYHLFDPLLVRDKPLAAAGSQRSHSGHGLSSHEIVLELRKRGFHPTIHVDRTTIIDLSGLFAESNSSNANSKSNKKNDYGQDNNNISTKNNDENIETERDEILSFMLQVEFSELKDPIKSDIVQYVYSACTSPGRNNTDRKTPNDSTLDFFFHHPTVAIEIRQNSKQQGTSK